MPIEPPHCPNIFSLFFVGHRRQISSVPIDILSCPFTLAYKPKCIDIHALPCPSPSTPHPTLRPPIKIRLIADILRNDSRVSPPGHTKDLWALRVSLQGRAQILIRSRHANKIVLKNDDALMVFKYPLHTVKDGTTQPPITLSLAQHSFAPGNVMQNLAHSRHTRCDL